MNYKIMRTYFFTENAKKDFAKLDINIKKQVIKKMDYYCSNKDPFQYARKLINENLWTWRFRVGDYRIICDVDEEWKIIIIALIWHRKNIYK